jgi:hypothetical protein
MSKHVNFERGNVLFYILIGVVLFAALGFAVSNMMRGEGDMATAETAKLGAQSILEYTQKAKITVQDMKLNGVETANLSFLKAGDAGYTTAPHTAKVFHPSGGGLPVPDFLRVLVGETLSPVMGVYMVRNVVEDVGSTADEVIVSVRSVKKAVCAELNRQISGSTIIPSTGANNHNALFITGATDLTVGVCASCVAIPAKCISQTGPTIYTFYSVIDAN